MRTTSSPTTQRRRLVAGAVVTAGAVAMASTAWACTILMGPLALTGVKTTSTGTPAGPRGSIVVAKATGLKTHDLGTGELVSPPTQYKLVMVDHDTLVTMGDRCHYPEQFLMEMKNPDGTFSPAVVQAPANPVDPAFQNGAFKVKLRIPFTKPDGSELPLGKSKICGIETSPNPTETATNHPTFKVTLT